ncbi:unnamed protein product [Closterium sp. NIES-64]|nr:unnamed protein product [Closterium sp. NIES-64]
MVATPLGFSLRAAARAAPPARGATRGVAGGGRPCDDAQRAETSSTRMAETGKPAGDWRAKRAGAATTLAEVMRAAGHVAAEERGLTPRLHSPPTPPPDPLSDPLRPNSLRGLPAGLLPVPGSVAEGPEVGDEFSCGGAEKFSGGGAEKFSGGGAEKFSGDGASVCSCGGAGEFSDGAGVC